VLDENWQEHKSVKFRLRTGQRGPGVNTTSRRRDILRVQLRDL